MVLLQNVCSHGTCAKPFPKISSRICGYVIDLSLATVAYAILITLVDLWYIIVSNLNCKSEVNTQWFL